MRALAALAAAVSLLSGAAHAQNLLSNTAFAPGTGFSGWTGTDVFLVTPCGTGSACSGFNVVSTTCCGGSPANGVETTAAAGANWRYLSQCVGGLSASTYDFGAWVIRSSDPLLAGSPSVSVLWYASADCTGTALSQRSISSASTSWLRLGATDQAPAGTSSAVYQLEALAGGLGGLATLDFGAPFFGPSGTVAVTLLRFSAD